ncbi:MAG: hypothetical protein, partial [Olavius algarvensis Gamma 1 endosymbiont]
SGTKNRVLKSDKAQEVVFSTIKSSPARVQLLEVRHRRAALAGEDEGREEIGRRFAKG